MKKGTSGQVVCRVCRKWLPKGEAVIVNEDPLHPRCLGPFLRRLARFFPLGPSFTVSDRDDWCIAAAYKIGREQLP